MDLLIHDLTAEEWERIAGDYSGWNIISERGGIRPCQGCFCCWTGTTGDCAIKDGYEKMGALIHEAGEVVVMSRYTYGGFSPFVKNVFDRSLGYVLPEFETAYGEMHHKKRYAEDKPVTFRFRGSGLSEEDKEKARRYVAAVCRNLRGSVKEVIFDECVPEEKPDRLQDRPRERSGILMINCSLRGERSNTEVFLKKLGEQLEPEAVLKELSRDTMEDLAEAVSRSETVVLGIPLYVDGLPSPALELMKAVKESGAAAGCRIYAVVNNGLYESRQNVNLLGMIRTWCEECGASCMGALAIGAGEVVGILMRDSKHPLWPARNAISGLTRLAKAIPEGGIMEDLYADTFLFPRWLYILIANTNWQTLKKSARNRSR